MSKYIVWHCHDRTGSTRDALSSIKDMVDKCAEHDMAFSCTNHGSIASWVELDNTCKEKKIKPIFGNEIYLNKNRDRIFEIRTKLKDKKLDVDERRILTMEKEDLQKNNHLLVVAKNQHGWHNLCELSNQAYVKGFYRFPLCTYEELFNLPKENDSRGIIVSSACLASPLNQFLLKEKFNEAEEWVKMMKEEFDKDFYLEVQAVNMDEQRFVNKKIIEYSKKFKIPAIIANDSHYINDSYSLAHERFLLLQGKQKVSDIGIKQYKITYEDKQGKRKRKKVDLDAEFKKDHPAKKLKVGDIIGSDKIIDIEKVNKVWMIEADDLSFKTEKEIREKVKQQHPELNDNIEELINTNKSIYDIIEEIHIDEKIKLPKIKDSDKLLNEKVVDGMKIKNMTDKKSIERVKYELGIIKKNGFAEYFLVLSDFMEYARKINVPLGNGRGSVVGSLVAYLLGIHFMNPFEWDFEFERFMAPEFGSSKLEIILDNGKKKILKEDDEVELKNGTIKKAKYLTEGDDIK